MNNYVVNKNTVGIIFKNGKSIIYENNGNIIENEYIPNKIIKNNCDYYGCSYDGRKSSSRNILGLTHKLPIIIEDTYNMVFFPIISPRLYNCSWFCLNNIIRCEKFDKYCKIYLNNNESIVINCSFNIFNNQLLRSYQLLSVIKCRKNENFV